MTPLVEAGDGNDACCSTWTDRSTAAVATTVLQAAPDLPYALDLWG